MKIVFKTDVDKLVKAFEDKPKETREMVRRQLKTTAERIKSRAAREHRYTSRSHDLERKGTRYNVDRRQKDGAVAYIYLDTNTVPYAAYIHEGTRAHKIAPRNRTFLRFTARGGDIVYTKREVTVSGIKPDPFLYQAAENEIPDLENRLSAELNRLMGEL